ncbi:MAG: DHHA1 domain-containing protein, partial [Bacteroidota bacterium]
VGIVASKLIEDYYRPTVVLSGDGEYYTGSVRSIKTVDVFRALNECAEVLVKFGGHVMAAGLTLAKDQVGVFMKRFDAAIQNQIAALPEKMLRLDAKVSLDEWSKKNIQILKRMAPFGPKNQQPLFLSEKVIVERDPLLMGVEKNHARLTLRQDIHSPHHFSAVFFHHGQRVKNLRKGDLLDIVYTVEENVWKGKTTVQLKIRDLKRSL